MDRWDIERIETWERTQQMRMLNFREWFSLLPFGVSLFLSVLLDFLFNAASISLNSAASIPWLWTTKHDMMMIPRWKKVTLPIRWWSLSIVIFLMETLLICCFYFRRFGREGTGPLHVRFGARLTKYYSFLCRLK